MGRLVLAIVAVAVLQIAFSIYMSYRATPEPTAIATRTDVPDGTAGLNAANAPGTSEEPTPAATDNDIGGSRAVVADNVAPINSRRFAEVLDRRADPKDQRSPAASVVRPSSVRYLENADRASVERQYFGRMVVERRFWPAKVRAKDTSAYVSRQVFGRMVVERTFGIAASQSANRTKAKKRRYVAKTHAPQTDPNTSRG